MFGRRAFTLTRVRVPLHKGAGHSFFNSKSVKHRGESLRTRGTFPQFLSFLIFLFSYRLQLFRFLFSFFFIFCPPVSFVFLRLPSSTEEQQRLDQNSRVLSIPEISSSVLPASWKDASPLHTDPNACLHLFTFVYTFSSLCA